MFLKNNFKSKIFKQIILIVIHIGIISSIFPIYILNRPVLATNNNFSVQNLSELKSAILESKNNDIIIIENNIYTDDEEVKTKNLDYSFDFEENNESNNENFLFTINKKKITIKGAAPNITISAKNSMGFFQCENNADLTLDNIILDGGENFKFQPFEEENPKDIESVTKFKNMSKYLKNESIIRCDENCKLTMNNCTIQNCCTLNNSLINISGSNAHINKNNKITKCACYQSSPIYIMASESQNIKSHLKIEDISLENCIVTGDNIATAISADEMSYLIIKNITTNNCVNVNSDIKTIGIFENSKCFFYDENAIAITIYNENGYIRTLKKYQNSNNLKILNKNNIGNTEFVNKITFDHTNENKSKIEPIYLSDNECMLDLKIGPLGPFYTTSTQGGTEDYKIPMPIKSNHKFIQWMCDNNTKINYETKFQQDTKLTALWINEHGEKIKLDKIEKIDNDSLNLIECNDKSPIESNTDIILTYIINDSNIIINTYEISLDGRNNFNNINKINDIKIIETTPNKLRFQLYKNGNYNIKIKAIDNNNNYVELDTPTLININKPITPTNNILNNNRLRSAKRRIISKPLTTKYPQSTTDDIINDIKNTNYPNTLNNKNKNKISFPYTNDDLSPQNDYKTPSDSDYISTDDESSSNKNNFPTLKFNKLKKSNFTPSKNIDLSIDKKHKSNNDKNSSNKNSCSDSVFNQKDNKTGIWVYAPAGVFNPNTKLFVKEIDKSSSEFSNLYNKMDQNQKQNINNTKLFQIYVENDKHKIVNPNISKGSITIRIPVPNSYNPDKFQIYKFDQNSDNEINKQLVKINEQYYYEFQTNDFDIYATINEQISNDFINLISIIPIISTFTIVLLTILIKFKNSKM